MWFSCLSCHLLPESEYATFDARLLYLVSEWLIFGYRNSALPYGWRAIVRNVEVGVGRITKWTS